MRRTVPRPTNSPTHQIAKLTNSRYSGRQGDFDRLERRRGLGRRQEQPAQQIAIETEQRDRVGDLVAHRLAPRLEARVALARQVLALLVVVPERLHLHLD